MPSYRVLVFHGNHLYRSEVFEAAGHIEAVEACVGLDIGARIEIWTAEGRIATIGAGAARRVKHDQLDWEVAVDLASASRR